MTTRTLPPWADGSDMAFVPVALAKQGVTFAKYEQMQLSSSARELTDEEVDQVLSGDFTSLGLTADAGYDSTTGQPHTGAMIALLPTEEDMERLVVENGEEDEELHLTLCYLGEAAKITPNQRDDIIRMVRRLAGDTPIVDADGFGVSGFNQQDDEKEPCVVLLVSGQELAPVHGRVNDLASSVMMGAYPEQHKPWIPHIALIYTDDASITGQLKDREGPIRFDHIRVAFGGEVTDFPLYDGTASSNTAEVSPVEENSELTADATLAGKKESDVNLKGGNHNLKSYWTHGEGAAKIGWGTGGDFTRCVTQLSKYVKSPKGLCAEYHHAATGMWPGDKRNLSAELAASIEWNLIDHCACKGDAVTAAADTGVDLEQELGEYDGGWIGPIVTEDSDTGDGRMFSGGSLSWADTTDVIHPFQWASANLGEHKGSVTAGRIDKMWRSPENPRVIMGKGRLNVNDPDGLRAFRQVRDGFAGGVSIDPDQVTDADVELEFAMGEEGDPFAKPTKTIFHKGRIRGATLVAFPALIEASIRLTKKGENTDTAVVASVTEGPWNALDHELRLGDDRLDGLVAAGAFALVRDIDDFVTRQQCRFLHHEIDENGQPGRASLVACTKHIAAINSGRTFGLDTGELKQAYDHMAQHFHDAGQAAPKFELEIDAVVASIPQAAPLEWFGDPKLSAPTPVTVTEDGRVFGHAACWGACHTGFADTCVTPPMENDYGYFTTGEVLTAEGHRVAVGQITLGTSHAPTRGVTLARAIDHYGDTGTAVADVTAGTDEHGIWIAGTVRPGVAVEQLHALRASALSGDWRRIGGQLRMVALLAVNVPGFPIPRVGTALDSGRQVSLVAAGVIDRTTLTFEDEIALLAGSCGIPAVGKKKKMMYTTIADELAALSAEIKE